MALNVDQHIRKASFLAAKGQIAEAEHLYHDILARFPSNRRAIEGLRCLPAPTASPASQQRLDAALALYDQGRLDDALIHLTALISANPSNPDLHHLAGAASAGLGRHEEARAHYDRALRLTPDNAELHSNRAVAELGLRNFERALDSCDKAIALRPGNAAAYVNRGIALRELGRPDEAAGSHAAALTLTPDSPDAVYNLANALLDLKRLEEAVACYDQAIRLRPAMAGAHANRGIALHGLGRHDEACAAHGQAIQLNPDDAVHYHNFGNVLKDLDRIEDAASAYAAAVALTPGFAEARAQLIHQRARMCLWSDIADVSALGIEGDAISPFSLLAAEDDARRHLLRARRWTAARFPGTTGPCPEPAGDPSMIRIGYFSGDFHNHATMHLIAKMLESHDRKQFEIHAFSYGPQRDDDQGRRARQAVDVFHEVGGLNDQSVANLARSHGIDIAVDLKGFTKDMRPGIFARRAAPVQIGFLGYPGSSGADYIDYLIADPVVIPASHRGYYDEKIISLPDSYQPNDDGRAIADDYITRSSQGLPDRGVVFCCFNNSFKITRAEFDIWMRLLGAVDGSVLWLLADNGPAVANLRREALARGIDPARLVFADRAPLPEHLARHRCADLFLDTFNYNAHTTASDALWAGLPVLTKAGQGFAARVAASLLHAVAMPELVTEDADHYERLALDLATTPGALAAARTKLAANLPAAALFDTARYTRHIETAYRTAHDRFRRGLAADHIDVRT